jgi:tetratricopeptide (TPR) repeat protein
MIRAVLAALVCCLVAGGAVPSAQMPAASHTDRASQWVSAVKAHLPNVVDQPVESVARWSATELSDALAAVPQNDGAEYASLLERALVLHVDIVLTHRTPTGYRLPPAANATVAVIDGRQIALTPGTFHWEFCRRIIARMPEGPRRTRAARLFYRATAAVLQGWGEYPELEAHVADARKVLGDDPVLLVYAGTLHQAYASPRTQIYLEEQRRAVRGAPLLPPPFITGVSSYRNPDALPRETIGTETVELRRAEDYFRRAIQSDPTVVEARIRLAHVLGDRGRQSEALSQLRRIDLAALPPVLDYYASLLLGRAQQAAGQLDAAARSFRRAVTRFPNAQAPRIALSQLAMARGDRAEAASHLTAIRTLPDGSGLDDPWWWLPNRHVPSAEELIAEMRRELAP